VEIRWGWGQFHRDGVAMGMLVHPHVTLYYTLQQTTSQHFLSSRVKLRLKSELRLVKMHVAIETFKLQNRHTHSQ